MNSEENKEKSEIKHRVHDVLASSYVVYFLALVFGLILSAIWPIKLFKTNTFIEIGLVFLFLSSMLILWAQRSSKKLDKEVKENITKESFLKGPYRFTRNPTNLGLFVSMTCFGIVINSFFVVLLTLVAFFFSRLFFIKKEEKLLEGKYGDLYLEYKKKVRF